MKRSILTLTSLVALGFAQAAFAEEAKEAPYSDKLLGDLGGVRSTLANHGVEAELNYTGDLWGVMDGGTKRIATYLDLAKLALHIDNEKLLGIKGNTVTLSALDSNGTRTNGSTVGSVQGIDNNEVSANGVRLYEAWVNQEFFNGRAAILFGLHDLNSEFDLTDSTANFVKPTLQIGQAFAQSGRNGPSIFPTTSLASRLRVKPTESTYLAGGIYDGVPGNPDKTKGQRVHLGDKDGALLVSEFGWTPNAKEGEPVANKLAFGGWHYTAKLDDLEVTGKKDTAQGVYALGSARLYADSKNKRDIVAFLRGGVADGKTAQVNWDLETGLVATGFVPGRPEGEIGFGVSEAHNGDKYMRVQAAAGSPADREEVGYELYYRDTIARGVTLQPDVQYVVNPGTDRTLDNAFIIGTRFNVSF